MEKYLFFNAKTAELVAVKAENSDVALVRVLRELKWDVTRIVYEGKVDPLTECRFKTTI